MKKRQFLGTAALAGVAAAVITPASARATVKGTDPALLTISGAIGKPNRGKLDPVRDQMMYKHKVSFEQACALDFAAIAALPAITIKPTLEYDSKPHTLSGPLLLDVVKAAGGKLNDNSKLLLRAVDGYVAGVTVAQARAHRYIVATHLDGAGRPRSAMGNLRGG